MELDLSKVSYSIRDLKRGIIIPTIINEELAFLMGIHLGDGNLFYDPKKQQYNINYTGHLTDEANWYSNFITPLFFKMFHIQSYIYRDKRENKNSIRILMKSKAIFTFFHSCLGLPSGKKDTCGVPNLIKNGSEDIKKAFLRGYVDTDFSLTFTRRKKEGLNKYPKICLSTNNKQLAKDTVTLLQELGYTPYCRYNFYRPRYQQPHFSNEININGHEQLEKWIQEIGFSSPKHLTKYLIWKKYGFCPPYTTLKERETILLGDLLITDIPFRKNAKGL